MFSKNQPSKPPAQSSSEAARKPMSTSNQASTGVPSILSQDLVVTGDISTDGEVQVEGRIEGNIKAKSLTIGEQGAVNGTIKADTVYIHGKVTGKVDAVTIELTPTANVLADLKQDNLTIANGAFFDGKCTRKTKPASPVKKAK